MSKRCGTCQFAPCRCEDLEAGYMAQAHTKKCWPMVSGNLSVAPDQIPAMLEIYKKAKITGITFSEQGDAIVADRGSRREAMQLRGFVDWSGGYGDTYGGKSCIGEHDPPPPKIRPKMPLSVRRG